MDSRVESKKFLQSIGAGVFVLLLFAAINAKHGAYLHALIEVGFAMTAFSVGVLFYFNKIKYACALYIFIALVSTLYLYLFYHGGIANTGVIWSLSFPVFAFLLSNKRIGLFSSAVHLLLIIAILLLSQWDILSIHYELLTLRQILSVYILICILAFVYQSKVEESNNLLKTFNSQLQEKIDIAVDNNRKQELHIFEQTKNAQMGEMIGMIAHQWRQPLNALSLIIQKIQLMNNKGALTSEKIDESVNKSVSLIESMSKTINDFMNYLKVDKEKQDFDLNSVFSEINSVLGMQLEKEKVTLQYDLDKNIIIHSYKSEFTHVLSNLISNALDAFSGKEIEDKRIIISAVKDEETHLLECSVKDNAGGIPDTIIDNIFNPYFTTKEQGKGTGIGLNMSKRIVEAVLEGTITVRNEANGAVFEIKIHA